jgi:hypothetical protein
MLWAAFAEIAQTTDVKGRPQSPAALQHLRTTLRAALNLAVREELIESNSARHIEIHGYQRPQSQVWPCSCTSGDILTPCRRPRSGRPSIHGN